MTKQAAPFLTREEAKELIEGPCAGSLFDYLYERAYVDVDHDTWVTLWEVDFPRDEFAKVSKCGVKVEDVSDLFGKLSEMFEEHPKYASQFQKICQRRYDDYCNSLVEDELSVDQAFEVATRPYGEMYDSFLAEVQELDDDDDSDWLLDDDEEVYKVEGFAPDSPVSDNPVGGYDNYEGGGNAGGY